MFATRNVRVEKVAYTQYIILCSNAITLQATATTQRKMMTTFTALHYRQMDLRYKKIYAEERKELRAKVSKNERVK